ncbi:hypothetical protein GY45DRAFT_784352 [Cubamyces sp. BRFM 1775]|nr:hypothetical protein GY45DRAFT_784352 [Cubamyces sp. BRFM 1775]
MTTLLAPIAEQNVGPVLGVDQDIEPDAQWKEETRANIEQGLQSTVDKVRQDRDAGLRGLREGTKEYEAVIRSYQAAMDRVRRLAEEQFNQELKIKRFELALSLGKEVEGEEFAAFRRQQQAIWDTIKREGAERPQVRRDSSVGGATHENGDAIAVPSRTSEHQLQSTVLEIAPRAVGQSQSQARQEAMAVAGPLARAETPLSWQQTLRRHLQAPRHTTRRPSVGRASARYPEPGRRTSGFRRRRRP